MKKLNLDYCNLDELKEAAIDPDLDDDTRKLAYNRYLKVKESRCEEDENKIKEILDDVLGFDVSKVVMLWSDDDDKKPIAAIVFNDGTWDHRFDIMEQKACVSIRTFLNQNMKQVAEACMSMIDEIFGESDES